MTLIDFDQVAESNINRQIQALGSTVGQAKIEALRQRIADIHPGCRVHLDRRIRRARQLACPADGAGLDGQIDGLIDACDQMRAKATLADWARQCQLPFVWWALQAVSGSRRPWKSLTLAEVTHDPLLTSLRQRLRKHAGAPRNGRIGTPCVFSRGRSAPRPTGESCGGWQPELCRLRLQRQRHRGLRALRRRRT